MGIPTIATSVGGIPDIVENGRTGWLYAHGDVEALGKLMQYVVDHPEERHAFGARMRKHVHEVHAPLNEVRKLVDVLYGGGEERRP